MIFIVSRLRGNLDAIEHDPDRKLVLLQDTQDRRHVQKDVDVFGGGNG